MISFLTESGTDFKETTTVGGFTNGMNKNNFDAAFESACDSLNQSGQGYDFMNDINALLKNDAAMESFKDSILSDFRVIVKEEQLKIQVILLHYMNRLLSYLIT